MKYVVGLLLGLLAGGLGGWPVDQVAAGVVARIIDSDEYVELSQPNERRVIERLPLYRSGGVRYFSAGVGREERMAEYPPFSLKLVFTAGGTPFLAGVSVTIHPATGGPALTIPGEQVKGPWLFVDLPPGAYDVTATHADTTQRLEGVKVEAGKQQTALLRWAADRGPHMTRTEE